MKIISIFFILIYIYFVNTLKSSSNQHSTIQTSLISNQQKLSKLKQLSSLINDPQLSTLLKLNLQTLISQKSTLLSTQFNPKQIQNIISIKQSLNQFKQCPNKSPYYDGLICISCQNNGQIFDLLTKKCALCKSGLIYDKKQKICVNRNTKFNIALTQMDLQKAQEILIIKANKIAATLMSFVHQKTTKLKYRLIYAQGNQTQTNKTNSQNNTPNITNPHFLNLIILSGDQKISQYELKQGDIACSVQQPFYSKDHCISCNYPTHLFDARTGWCVKCSNNFIYSVKNHQCVKLPNIK